jgi:hypothetical protein
MRKVSLFAEDFGHEAVIAPLARCVAAQYGTEVAVRSVSVRGGFGCVQTELKDYVADLMKYKESLPDLIVVATDANCTGYIPRLRNLQGITEKIRDRVVYAVPDPHVERWLLRDPAAFKAVLGKPCKLPKEKCGRDRYKKLLVEAVRDAGTTPLLGGMEYAGDIVGQMDLRPTAESGDFGSLLQELHARFRLWKGHELP